MKVITFDGFYKCIDEYATTKEIFTVGEFYTTCREKFPELTKREFLDKAVAIVSRWGREGTVISVGIRGDWTLWRRVPSPIKKW